MEKRSYRPSKRKKDDNLPGLKLSCVLQGHAESINQITWLQNSNILASSSYDRTIQLWDTQMGKQLKILQGHSGGVNSVAWSPSGDMLASGSDDGTVQIWYTQTGKKLKILQGHFGVVNSVAWSPSGDMLAFGSNDTTVRTLKVHKGWQEETLIGHSKTVHNVAWSPNGKALATGSDDNTIRIWSGPGFRDSLSLSGHSSRISSLAWSPDGKVLASGSHDRTICLWDPNSGKQQSILEGHTGNITSVSFAYDGLLLASKSLDGTIRIWRTDTWETVKALEEKASGYWPASLAFHPNAPVLATLGEEDMVIRIWNLDVSILLGITPIASSVHYSNAKVVLVGDSGVGKSGLALVLCGEKFAPTESTHGRRVWTFDSREIELSGGRKETRETLLWDLAGQPGYRLIHQLHLNEVAVALVLFDTRSETDPFGGVEHWYRALRQAQRIQGSSALPMKMFLVAARIDRGGIGVSKDRIKSLVQALGFNGYFETSAREGWNIPELKEAIRKGIDWEALPKVVSTDLFQRIKDFLVAEKEAGRLLSTVEDLYRTFLSTQGTTAEIENLSTQFETCIGRVESRDLIKRLSFGNLILLQPELLDAYASALINAVKDEPEGLGSIDEERVRMGAFSMSKDERIKDLEQEKLLLIAMVEDLLRRELVLREESFLVFPSQSTRENPDLPDPESKSVVFMFEGPILSIYATLAVRLAHSDLFLKKDIWKNAITYTAKAGGVCGMFLHNIGEGRGELTLFFDKADPPSEETHFHFEEYVQVHLQRRSLEGSLKRRRIFICNDCGWVVTDQTVQLLAMRRANTLDCPVCRQHILLLDRKERLISTISPRILEMDRAADSRRDLEVIKSALQGRRQIGDFDVFLCHHNIDKPIVKKIGERLMSQGILPWLDEWELRPGLPWQNVLAEQIKLIKSAAVFIGKDGIGPWQDMELNAFLRQFVKRKCPVIPVILPYCEHYPEIPLFLENITWVDFRRRDPNPMTQLIWGITGQPKKSQ